MNDIILGLDPGTRRAGFGVIHVSGDKLTHIEHGVISMNETWPLSERLKVLQNSLNEVFDRHKIASAVVEKIFLGRNADSAFKLGHARGVCLVAAAHHGAAVEEYAARYVKKCVTGSGAASKEHVQLVVFQILGLKQTLKLAFDASDALSLAVTHARVRESGARMRQALEGEL